MPSQLNLRERLRLRPTSHDGASTLDLSTALSVQTVATSSTTIAAPSTMDSNRDSSPSSNHDSSPINKDNGGNFSQHLAKLRPDEKSAFRTSHQTLTAESILVKVRDYDRARNHDSNSRKCAEQVEKSLRILSQFLRSIAIAIQSNPEISSLIVGGVRFILDLGLNFVAFFRKLSDMIEELFDYIDPLQQFDYASDESDLVCKTLSDVYGDLLDFCRQARRIFADNKGQPRIQTLQYNAILDGNCAAAVERQRAQQKDAEETRKNFMNWICITDFEKEHALTFEKRYKDTGNWLLEEPVFEQWFDVTDSRVLWCYGKRNLSS
ncbi:hypothetical protein MMC31_002860 [Peltigera leucophlebia]|nr:hypothetical protein [Peltigera leucophlebia]